MKQELEKQFLTAIAALQAQSIIPSEQDIRLQFERTRQKEHGDFATNIAMMLAKAAGKNPRELAQLIVDALPASPVIDNVAIAGPGFINVFVANDARYAVIDQVLAQADRYGLAASGSQRHRILLEYVSANPTGPLHVGHGRGAAYGDALARLLVAAGYDVHREYYVNDAGRQMDILATSVWLRYLQATGEQVTFPENAYQGDYVQQMGEQLFAERGEQHRIAVADVSAAQQLDDHEAALDAVIDLAKTHLGDAYNDFFQLALTTILADIRDDLADFGVEYDDWFSERSLFANPDQVTAAIEALKATDYLYQRDGAWWFKSTAFDDEKDRVVVRDNGAPTYFASDIAYHLHKFQRGFDTCIDIWGADHHGYVPRVKAVLQALGQDPEKLQVLLVQFAVLYRGDEKVPMSTRSGQFVTLRDLRSDVGRDPARFYYVQRKPEQHMDFDLDLAVSQSNDNPVYYVQYAHARICRVFKTAAERGIAWAKAEDYSRLDNDAEYALLTLLAKFPEVVTHAAGAYEPHQISYYLRDLATGLHSYYNACKFLDVEDGLRTQRLTLLHAVRQVLQNGLQLLGVSAPQSM